MQYKKVKIYIEGGGDQASLKTKCRKAFSKFFEKAGFKGKMPGVIACGSRNEAYSDFCTAVKISDKTGTIPFLLVDSEELLAPEIDNHPWHHLEERDGWQKPAGIEEHQTHMMVQCMEAWFLADKKAVETYFGSGFNINHLPQNSNIEAINKKDLLDGLNRAARNTKKEGYSKSRHSFDILESLDASLVIKHSKWTKRLVEELGKVL